MCNLLRNGQISCKVLFTIIGMSSSESPVKNGFSFLCSVEKPTFRIKPRFSKNVAFPMEPFIEQEYSPCRSLIKSKFSNSNLYIYYIIIIIIIINTRVTFVTSYNIYYKLYTKHTLYKIDQYKIYTLNTFLPVHIIVIVKMAHSS